MSEAMLDAFRHSAWANQRLIEYCRSLGQEQLGYQVPGTYGSALRTLKHLCGAEAFYRFLFVGDFPDWDWGEDDHLPTPDQLQSWSSFLAASWEDLLSRPIDKDLVLEHRQEDGRTRRATAGVVPRPSIAPRQRPPRAGKPEHHRARPGTSSNLRLGIRDRHWSTLTETLR
jgi:uncharacterized damage-inducible protein DinB